MSFYLSHSKLSDGLITQKIPLISRTDSSTLLGGSNSASMGGCSPSDPKPSPPQFLCTPDSQPALPFRFLSAPFPPRFLLPSPGIQTRKYKKENSNWFDNCSLMKSTIPRSLTVSALELLGVPVCFDEESE